MGFERIETGDALSVLKRMESGSVQCVVTSPPYWGLRDYGVNGQLGLEKTPEEYVAKMVKVFREVRRVLRDDGTLWLNLGDSYAGSGNGQTAMGSNDPKVRKTKGMKLETHKPSGNLKPKDLVGMPWRVAFALQEDGWWLRSDIIWSKPNPITMRDRKYNPNGRNLRTVWTIPTQPYPDAHFAVYPEKLVEPCIKAGTSEKGACPDCGAPWTRVVEKTATPQANAKGSRFDRGKTGNRDGGERTQQGERYESVDIGWQPSCKCVIEDSIPCVVMDPFSGAGTTGVVAKKLGRSFIGIEINHDYVAMAGKRLAKTAYQVEMF